MISAFRASMISTCPLTVFLLIPNMLVQRHRFNLFDVILSQAHSICISVSFHFSLDSDAIGLMGLMV